VTDTDRRVARTFVELADTLVVGFDVIEFLELLASRCAELLAVDAAGLVLADQRGALTLVAASDEQARLVELVQLEIAEGACLDCYRSGQPVSCADLSTAGERWPRFAPAALEAGFASVHAAPMRLREEIIGALSLFGGQPGELDESARVVGQALADVATIGILHERAMRRTETLTEQLQNALNSRVLIEQAKGVLAERVGIGVDEAFGEMRRYARAHSRKLLDLAAAVVHGDATADDLVERMRTRHTSG
jgi:transcriptional regulator with GAF, ATPase, and Fis domain